MKFEKYKKQFQFLNKQKIETTEDLSVYKNSLINQISSITELRKTLYKKRSDIINEEKKEKLSGSIPVKEALSEKINDQNRILKTLRFELRLCESIEGNTAKMQEQLQEVNRNNEVLKLKNRNRGDLKHEQRF